MLNSIKIERFKSIKDVEMSFGRVNLFIGGNGSGKSNVLEALGVVAAALHRGVTDDELARKGVRLTPPTLMKSAFKNEGLPKTFSIECEFSRDLSYSLHLTSNEYDPNLSFFAERCELGRHRLFGQSSRGTKIFGESVLRSADRSRSVWDISRSAFDYPFEVINEFDRMARYSIYAPQTEFLREIKAGRASQPPIGLHGEGLAYAVDGLIKYWREMRKGRNKSQDSADYINYDYVQRAINLTWLPGWTRGFQVGSLPSMLRSRDSITTDGQVVYFIDKYMHEKRNTLAAYDSSEGTLFLLFLAVLMAHPSSPPVFALDNFDNALNPLISRKMVSRIIEMVTLSHQDEFEGNEKQVFFTSHNPTALDAFDLFDEEQRVFVVSRNDRGHTTVNRLQPKKGWTRDKWAKAHKGRKLSQLWIDGVISGALGPGESI